MADRAVEPPLESRKTKTGAALIMLVLCLSALAAVVNDPFLQAQDAPRGTLPGTGPLHYLDAGGGYGLVAPVSLAAAPVIDGVKGAAEWSDSLYDGVSVNGTSYYRVHAMVIGGFLYAAIVLDPAYDSSLENGDLCALLIDANHDGGAAPQTDDWMITMERQPPMRKVLKQGNGAGWTTLTWPAGWEAALDDAAGSQEVCEFKVDAVTVLPGGPESIVGFGAMMHDVNGPGFNDTHWPDELDPMDSPEDIPDRWGHLIYGRPTLLINEVSSGSAGNLEFIELYNNNSEGIDIRGLNVSDQDGNEAMLPSATIPAHSSLFVRSGTGTDDLDLGDGQGTVYVGGADWWADAGDDVLLRFGGNGCSLDYMQYGAGPQVDAHPADASSNSGWTQDTPPLAAPTQTQSLHRTPNGEDSNLSSDWSLFDALANPLHHIALVPIFSYPSANVVAAGGTLPGYSATGWNDASELERNRTWAPTWGTTDARGTAQSSGGDWITGFTADYIAGTVPGPDNVTVVDTPSAISNASSIRIIPDVPFRIAILSGNGQVYSAGAPLPDPFIVEVADAYGNPLSGENVWFNITTAGLNGDGILSTGNPVQTDASGRASTTLTLDSAAGANTVTAECGCSSISQAVFAAVGRKPVVAPGLEANATQVPAGRTFTYFVHFDNQGSEAATDVFLNGTLSTYLDYVSDTSGATPTVVGQAYSWHFASLPVGAHGFTIVCRVDPGTPNGAQISYSFTVEYSNQLGIRLPTGTSNTVVVIATDKLIANSAPKVEGVPDLVVRYGYQYGLDLSPYVSDADNGTGDLRLLLSDTLNAVVDSGNNLRILLNYSVDYLGTVQELNITVADGYGSGWQVIMINVTADYPPELSAQLPDIAMDEDTAVYPFVISDYFFDRDGDPLAFNHSASLMTIEILGNSSVHVVPPKDWFGTTNVTFRALDDLGALCEDTVTIKVAPINDPPLLSFIPDQEGKAGTPWTLDLSSYIQDVDSPLWEITISSTSQHVTIDGLKVTFSYSEKVDLDVVDLTLSDGKAQVNTHLGVRVLAAHVWEGPMFWAAIAAVLAIMLLLLLALEMRRSPGIEDAFLIYMDGSLLAHASREAAPGIDSEIFSSMLTAIQDFVKDSFERSGDWGLKKIGFRDRTILLERSKSGTYSIVLIFKGKGKEEGALRKAKETLAKVEEKYGGVLGAWDGDMKKVEGIEKLLTGAFEDGKR